ncbi:hypothetical protein G9A89_008576 [Geosiphon pyriformis]|nr:hypothetical protein G9A89_008576 [Geosiphon pyriformis]
MISAISLSELLLVVNGLPNGKAAGLSGIPNKLWKHDDNGVLGYLLRLLNACLLVSSVPVLWRRAWVSIIPKSYDWDRVFMNTWPIALIKTARKILSKIFFDKISSVCSKFSVLCGDNFSVLKGMSIQSPVFVVGLVVENALEKDHELWLVLQDMHKAYDSRLDPRGSVSFWFVTVMKFLLDMNSSLVVSAGSSLLPKLDVLNSMEFSDIQNGLHEIWSGLFDVYTDESLKNARTADIANGTAAYFFSVNISVGVKLQMVTLVLECVLSSCAMVLYLDSQIAIDVCIKRHHIFNLVRDKDFVVRWVKVKGHSGVVDNVETDVATGYAMCSKFSLPVRIHEHFLMAEDTAISGNSICHARWEAGSGQDVVLSDLVGCVNWSAMAWVWHPNSHMLAGFTNWESSVEMPDHVFTCVLDAGVWEEVLAKAFAFWNSLLGVVGPASSAVLQALSQCSSDVDLYSVLCKKFVLKDWYEEAINVFDEKKEAFCMIIGFVRQLAELYHSKIWLVRCKHRAKMERAGLVGNDSVVSDLDCSPCVVLGV